MRKIIFAFTGLLLQLSAVAQLAEHFSDGNFTVNPAWTGNTGDWQVNAALQLQSNSTAANSSFYLSTSSNLATVAEWEWYVQLGFNTSSTNYADVFLTASAGDISAGSTTGYFVRIGSTDDDICLYRKDGGTQVKLIDGVNGLLNSSNNIVKIRVTRDGNNHWTLLRDGSGSGTNFIAEGVAQDATYRTGAYFGILVKQSTASFFQRHYFDDITISPYVPDIIPPSIQRANATTANSVDVLFDEPVELTSSQLATNYTVDNSIGIPAVATRDGLNASLVHLTFTGSLPPRIALQLIVNGVKDLAGNISRNASAPFVYFVPYRHDILIDEIMADPTPVAGLPAYEWIELRNVSPFAIDLKDWRVGDAGSSSGPLPAFVLKPDSMVIVCGTTAATALTPYGPVLALTGFPSLDNTNDVVYLAGPQGNTIHAVNYTDKWYGNELKKEGGWSLEMKDYKNPCGGTTNWSASTDVQGGTPGRINAINAVVADKEAPRIIRAYAADPFTISILFNEPLDSAKAATAVYSISDAIGTPLTVIVAPPLFDLVILRLGVALQENKVYAITVTGITDCSGNDIGTVNNKVKAGLAKPAGKRDIVINEVLFNPRPGGNDFVEIYNRGNSIIDLQQLFLANRNAAGAISSMAAFSTGNRLLFPGAFAVATTGADIIQQQYIVKDSTAFCEVPAMPAYNDDKGDVVLLNAQGEIIDELLYNEQWHFRLIDNNEGISLERIDYNDITQKQDNWHSAAASAGFATPSAKNSQYRPEEALQAAISISPEIVSPDNDGIDDVVTIAYEFPSPGYVANITIFDAAGRVARLLQQSALCGIKGNFRWDGLGEKYQPLPVGIYIVYTQVFNLEGKQKQFKQAIVLARRR